MTIVRHVVAESFDEHVSQEAFAEQSLVDNAIRTRRGSHAFFAGSASVLLACDLVHDGDFNALEFATDVDAHLVQLVAAALASTIVCGEFVGRAKSCEVLWKLPASTALLARRRRLDCVHFAVALVALGGFRGLCCEIRVEEVPLVRGDARVFDWRALLGLRAEGEPIGCRFGSAAFLDRAATTS